jgi:iron complex outermembrane receptor protein
MKKSLFLFFFIVYSGVLYAQADSISQLLQLSIENLMNVEIYSASKSNELAFDAPLSSTVITREQIRRAGCTSIPEALRLAPGMIVREQSNGNYDIHIRGLDNVPPNSNLIFFASSTTLVMIDSRPVYNYLHGGTFWEALPIDLNDVERIEVVRGPCAALYGPNAVSGVINIITRKPESIGLYALANGQYGSYNSLIANTSVGYKFNDKISAWVSGNYQHRNRTQTNYYNVATDKFVPIDSVTAVKNAAIKNQGIARESYPHPEVAMNKYGVNGFVNYEPVERIQFDVAIGGQHSEVQKEFGTGFTSLTTSTSNTRYANLTAGIHDFRVQASYLWGTEAPALGQKIWHWDLATTDVVAEYNIEKINNLTIRPGIAYRRADYNDTRYVNTAIKEGLWSGVATSETRSATLHTEYLMMDEKLRLIGAGRMDNFNYPAKIYLPYQLATTYKINDDNELRVSVGTAYRTPLLIDLFSKVDLTGAYPLTNPSQTYLLQVRGNKNIRLLKSTSYVIGYRTRIKNKLEVDASVFYTSAKNFTDLIFGNGIVDSSAPVAFKGTIDISNLTLQTQQLGSTLSAGYVIDKWQFTANITLQQSYLIDYSPYTNSPIAPPLASNNFNPAVYNMFSNQGTKIYHKGTPTYFGGFYINYKPYSKLNLNLNGYYYAAHTQLEIDNLTYHTGARGVENIGGQLLLNAGATYSMTRKINIFANFRNCLNANRVEFYKGDPPAFMAFGGAQFEF